VPLRECFTKGIFNLFVFYHVCVEDRSLASVRKTVLKGRKLGAGSTL
jgi:hypothetical protein